MIVQFSLAVPAILGMFLGAPAVAREAETGTAHFAWTQAVTRRRWLAVKAGWLLLAALAWGGAVGALVTWWSGPQNAVAASQFNPGSFDIQGIMPAAYSLFAMALGIAAGTLIRRVLPALGVTLGVFFAVRLIIMDWVRQHYMTPVTGIYNVALDNAPRPKGAAWILGRGIPRPERPAGPPRRRPGPDHQRRLPRRRHPRRVPRRTLRKGPARPRSSPASPATATRSTSPTSPPPGTGRSSSSRPASSWPWPPRRSRWRSRSSTAATPSWLVAWLTLAASYG